MIGMKNRRVMSVLLAVASWAGVFASVGPANADDHRRGFYVGVELGFANPSDVTSTISGVNHPTRCDRLLYPASSPPAAIANDTDCTANSPRPLSNNSYDLGTGFLGGLSLGYTLDRFRVEFEYMNRSHGGDSSRFQVAGGNQALISKDSEWNGDDPPSERISDFIAHQFFVNAYYDVLNDSRWTPYLGGGFGWARTSMRYTNRFVRKPEDEYLEIAFDPDWDQAAKAEAAGTLSFWDTRISDTIFGFQFMGGLDYALTESVSIGVKGRWAKFGDISHGGVWNLIRSHKPVQADGTTPFTSQLMLDDVEYWAMTLGLKYHF